MCNYPWLSVLITACLLSFAPVLIADDENQLTALDWLNKDKELQEWCKQNPLDMDAKVFGDTLKKTKVMRVDFCDKKFTDVTELQMRIIDLLGDLKIVFPVTNLYLQMHATEVSRVRSTGEVAPFEVLDDPLLAISLDHNAAYRIENNLLNECNQSAKRIAPDMDCQLALEEFENIYNFAQGTYAQPLAFELSKRLDLLESRWNDFYNESKSQMLWEMAINGAIFQKDNDQHKFAEPPRWQLVFMHPTIVVENVADAIDGDQFKEAIMIEAIGADWWQQDKWFLPSGGSLIATYSDRLDVDDWGYGVALNFNSKFTMGVSDHGDDSGVFITVDFLKLLQDKKSTLESYREVADF